MLWVKLGLILIAGHLMVWAGESEIGQLWTACLVLLGLPFVVKFFGQVRLKDDFYGNAHAQPGSQYATNRKATRMDPGRRAQPKRDYAPFDDSDG